MTTYRSIASTETDPDSPVTATLMQALADNPTAISEGETGAPYLGAVGHPYTGVLVGDANTGILYNFAVDGPAASIQTPDFQVGYRMSIQVHDYGHNSGTDQRLIIEWFDQFDVSQGTSNMGNVIDQSTTAELATASRVLDTSDTLYGVVKWESGASFDEGRIFMFRELSYAGRTNL